MIRIAGLIISVILVFSFSPLAQDSNADVLKMALDSVGLNRADIGFQPKGYWSRFPLDIPYKLSSFDALFAEPFKLYDYSKTMANAVERYFDPSFMDTSSVSLYNLVYSLGVDRRQGGFRNYSANLIPVPDTIDSFEKSIDNLYQLAGRRTVYYSFGNKVDWPDYKGKVKELNQKISSQAQLILAGLIYNVGEIIRWRDLAFRNCPREAMEKAFGIRDLASNQGDGTVYYSEIDDIAGTIDWPSLHYAGLKGAAIVEQAVDSLQKYGGVPVDLYFEITTPFGRIIFWGAEYLKQQNISNIDCNNTLLAIDFGGHGSFQGSAGGNFSLSNPVSIFIDLGGNDTYNCRSESPSFGAGVMGVGVLYDAGGNDVYKGKDLSQGCGQFGVGVLLDKAGNDKYNAELSAQGCGYFGIGLCFDGSGIDSFYVYGDGQGFGGVGGGVGVLADYSGNDYYEGEPFAKNFNRGDYHSNNTINGNGVQGVGFGRRGDGTDGHSWAGGLGAIIDISGNDHYYSGNWSLGCGYWFATGIAFDVSGDDFYESCYFTQGSGAHYCNGVLIDEAGNDRHELFETAGAGLGFGWDYTNAFLINLGGNDIYRAKMISMGLAQIRSNGLLIDIGGDDSYYLGKDTPGLGEATDREDYHKPSKLAPFNTYCKSLGCLIDIGGVDRYLSFTSGAEIVHPRANNNSIWFAPAKNDSSYGGGNFGIGIDVESGIIPEIEKWK